MSGLYFDAILNSDPFVKGANRIIETMKTLKEEAEKTNLMDSFRGKIDLSNPKAELARFDEQVQSFTKHLDDYFDVLQVKLKDIASVISSQPAVGGTTATSGNAQQISELQRQNEELIAQVKQRQEEIEKERSLYKQLADAVRTNNIPALQQLAQQEDEASKRLRLDEARNSLKAVSQEMTDLAKRMAETSGEVDLLEANLKDLKAGNDPTATDEKIAETERALEAQRTKLSEMKDEYNEMAAQQRVYAGQVQQSEGHHIRIRTEIMNAREEMMRMIDAGQRGTPEFEQLAEDAGKMRREMALANATMQYFADPNKNLHTLKTGLQGVAGAVGLVTGVMGVFNEDSKKMAEIQSKVASIMSIIVGLETTYNLVKKSSNVMLAIEEVRTWAIAKARGVQATATAAATAAQEGLNTAMRSNPIGAIISLLAILGTAIYAVTKAIFTETEAEKKAREEKENHTKAIREQHEQWAKSVADSASKQIASYNELKRKWDDLGDDLKAKEKFVNDNQEAFHNLGFAVGSVTDAENILLKNTDAVVAAIMARAKAAAYQSLVTEEIKKQIQRDIAAESINGGQYRTSFTAGQRLTSEQYKAYEERYGRRVSNNGYKGVAFSTDIILNEEGAREMNELASRYAAQQRRKAKEVKEASDNYLKTLKESQKKDIEAEKQVLKDAGIKEYVKPEKKDNATREANAAKKRLEAQQRIAELMDKQAREQERKAENTVFSTREAEIKAMENGTARTLKQIELDRDKELAAIRRSYEDLKVARIEEARKLWEADPENSGRNFFDSDKFKGTDWDAAYTKEEIDNKSARETAAFKTYVKGLDELVEANRKAINDYLRQYGDYAQKKQAIYEEANDRICEYEEELSQATTEEAREAAQARINIVKEETNEQIKELDVQYGKAKKFMVDLFEETAHKSVSELQKIIDKYKSLLKFLKGDSSVSRQMLKNLGFSDGQIDEALKNAREKGVEFFKTISDGIKNIEGDVSNMSVWQKLKKKIDEASKAFEKDATTDPKKQGVAMSELAEVAEEAIPIFSDLASEMLGAFNIDDSSLKQATQSLATFAQLANSIGKIKSGDKLNGILGIASAVFSVGSTIFNAIEQEKEAERQKEIRIINHTLELTNERLQTLNDTLQKSYGIEALELSQQAVEEVIKRNQQAVEGLKVSQMVDSNEYGLGFQWNVLAKIIGDLYNLDYGEDRVEDFGYGWKGSMWEDILNNTSVDRLVEVFSDIKRNSPDIWANLLSIRESDVEDFLNTLVASEEEINNISETLNQQLTTTTESNVFDSFLDSLYILADGSEDVMDDIAENWQKMVNKMVVNNLVGNQFQSDLQAWYKKLAETMQKRTKDGDTKQLQNELNALKDEYDDYVALAQAQINQLREMGIVQSPSDATSQNQSASVSAMERITTDQAEELIGRMNAGQMLWQQGNDQRALILQSLASMQEVVSGSGRSFSEMVTLMQTANSHLQSIYENNKKSYIELGEKIDKMTREIGNL